MRAGYAPRSDQLKWGRTTSRTSPDRPVATTQLRVRNPTTRHRRRESSHQPGDTENGTVETPNRGSGERWPRTWRRPENRPARRTSESAAAPNTESGSELRRHAPRARSATPRERGSAAPEERADGATAGSPRPPAHAPKRRLRNTTLQAHRRTMSTPHGAPGTPGHQRPKSAHRNAAQSGRDRQRGNEKPGIGCRSAVAEEGKRANDERRTT